MLSDSAFFKFICVAKHGNRRSGVQHISLKSSVSKSFRSKTFYLLLKFLNQDKNIFGSKGVNFPRCRFLHVLKLS